MRTNARKLKCVSEKMRKGRTEGRLAVECRILSKLERKGSITKYKYQIKLKKIKIIKY